MDGLAWLAANTSDEPWEIPKANTTTRAWLATIEGRATFVKWYPAELRDTWARIEAAISGAGLHPAIIPLRSRVDVADGAMLLYDRVEGESLGPQAARARFAALPLAERAEAVQNVSEALAAIVRAGYTVVDWYEDNMVYDFGARRLWLCDWELCREGGSFVLEMDANYGSSRLMAPEESVRGSQVDGATLVFNLGRYALLNLPELAEPLASVLARATYPARAGRYGSPDSFVTALREALSLYGL